MASVTRASGVMIFSGDNGRFISYAVQGADGVALDGQAITGAQNVTNMAQINQMLSTIGEPALVDDEMRVMANEIVNALPSRAVTLSTAGAACAVAFTALESAMAALAVAQKDYEGIRQQAFFG